MFANLTNLSKRLFDKLSRKPYREAYVAQHVSTGVAYQIRALREQRGWNQGRFARELGKPQSVANRFENLDYGKYSLTSLLEIAATFDVALSVRFVSFPDFLRQYSNVTPEAFHVESFADSSFLPCEDGNRMLAENAPARNWQRVMVGAGSPASAAKPRFGEICAAVN